MFDAYDIDQYLQYLLHDAQAQMWDAQKRLHAINRSYDQICNRVIEAHENYFFQEATLTPGASTWEHTAFTLPAMPTVQKIVLVTDNEGNPIKPILVQRRDRSAVLVQASGAVGDGYWLGHDQLFVNANAYSGNLRLYYIKRPPTFITGMATAGATDTITFAASPTPEIRDDYYNDCWARLKVGTGAGERAQITDYDGGTLVATVDFSTTPDATSIYATESELPEGHNELISMGAAIRCLQFDVAQVSKLQHLMLWYKKMEYDLMDFLEVRQTQAARSIYMRNDD
jgi:hypothetical protein